MYTRKVIIFGITLFLSSCGIYTKYQPQTSVPDNLYGEEAVGSDTTNMGCIHWRDFFTDPYLQDLIEKGLKQNTDVRTAELRVEEAKASLLSAKLAFLPSFALSPQGGVNTVESQVSRTYTLPVTASWEIDIFGKLRNSKRQAKAAYAQSEDYKQAVYSSLVANIANTYYTLLMLDEQLEISKTTAETWKETVASTQALMEAGQADEAAVSQMKATCYEVENSVIDLEEQINQVENTLSLLLAETPHEIPRGKLAEQSFNHSLSLGVPIQLLANRPDVLITNPGKFVTSALASLTEPLFNKGTLIARRRIAKAQQEEALLAFKQKLLDAGTEVNDALVSYQTSKKKKDNYQHQIASLEKAFNSTSLLMQYGNTTYLEVLTAHQTLLSARLSQTANCFKEIQSMINLYQALGGGQDL